MSVQLENVIPWGRTMREYELMFDLRNADLRGRILGCGDGPASFNAEMTRRGFFVVSFDPIYVFSAEQILDRFNASIEPVMSQVKAHPQNYVWKFHKDPGALLRTRQAAIKNFISDYATGLAEERYFAAELPELPFASDSFDLALCSHLLFLYSDLLSLEFHLQSIIELCRVAKELRIFPITSLDCEISRHLPPLLLELKNRDFRTEILEVDYQLQRNGGKMVRISK